jgi:hypothetical protein
VARAHRPGQLRDQLSAVDPGDRATWERVEDLQAQARDDQELSAGLVVSAEVLEASADLVDMLAASILGLTQLTLTRNGGCTEL